MKVGDGEESNMGMGREKGEEAVTGSSRETEFEE